MRQERLPHGLDETSRPAESASAGPLRVAGLFAGIGGVEAGLEAAGHHSLFLCEIDPAAREVLRERFPGAELAADVAEVKALPEADLLVAGFPCQDLSIAGPRNGIAGQRSGLVQHVFRLLDSRETPPRWLLLENVPFILELQRGEGMRYLLAELERRGFSWAYRVVDTRAFGLPHRRSRVLLLASKSSDPAPPLLGCDTNGPTPATFSDDAACGFYWTEGHRGIAWSVDCVPPIKVGSTLGIPSGPAVWHPASGAVIQPDIRDLERLQGFEAGWTRPSERVAARGARWRLVGNSVSVPLAAWIGTRLTEESRYDRSRDWPMGDTAGWPQAGWGGNGRRFESTVSMWPVAQQLPSLASFLEFGGRPLSRRAARGLLSRLLRYGAKVPERFLKDLSAIAGMSAIPSLPDAHDRTVETTSAEPLTLWDTPEYDVGR